MEKLSYLEAFLFLMNKTPKILLSIPSIIVLCYLPIFWFPEKFSWLIPSMKAYYIQVGILQVLAIVQWGILVRKLWCFNHLPKSKKYDWTWILFFFNPISSIIFLWIKMDEFEKLNNIIMNRF